MSDLIIPKKYIERLDARTESGEYFFNKNKTVQSIYDRSTTKHFPIGTRWQLNDRTFFYGKVIANLNTSPIRTLNHGLVNSHITPTDIFEGAVYGTPVAGDTEFYIMDTGTSTTRPKDYYQGGYVQIYRGAAAQSVTNFDAQRRIVHSSVGNSTKILLTLDYPLTCAITATVDVYPSAYSEIAPAESISSGEETFVGFAHAPLQAGEYGWFQTWGPVNGHYNIKFPGESCGSDRDCYFNAEGDFVTLSQGGSFSGKSYQRAGYVLPCTKSLYGSVFIMLQLAP
jgi:hypothetical protein